MTIFNDELNLSPVILRAKSVQERISELVNFIKNAPENSLIVASELCISGYDFDGFFSGANVSALKNHIGGFDAILIENLQEALGVNKFLAFTHLTSVNLSAGLAQISNSPGAKIYNEFALLSGGEMLYTQPKCKLFRPNLEHEKFDGGEMEKIRPFEFKGIKFGVLICFELRFVELWAKLKECEIIIAPAMWGEERKDAYLSLCKALAIANNCYVVASSSLDLEFAGVFSPTGELKSEAKFDRNLIAQTKRNLGIL